MPKTWKRNGHGNTVIKGHIKGTETRSFCLYTVYDNRTDLPVIIDGEATDAAEAMGLTLGSFYSVVSRADKPNAIKRWTVYKRFIDENT